MKNLVAGVLLNINLFRSNGCKGFLHPFFDSSHGSNLWDSQAGAQVLITCRSDAENDAAESLRDVAVLTCLGRCVAAVEKAWWFMGVPGEGIGPSDEFIYYICYLG